jgi:hypothetical protein
VEHSDFEELIKGQVSHWQRILRLMDWQVQVQYWPHEALDDAVSKIRFSRNQKYATLALRRPEQLSACEHEWPEGEANDYDMSIVHELLHLKCLEMESKVDWAEEQLCNHLASAIVSTYRDGQATRGSLNLEAARPLPEGDLETKSQGGYL